MVRRRLCRLAARGCSRFRHTHCGRRGGAGRRRSGWRAMRLPSTFFPEIDESMERIYVRLAPGTSLEEASAQINEMGEPLASGAPPGDVELVLTNVGSPNNARSAMTSPNQGPTWASSAWRWSTPSTGSCASVRSPTASARSWCTTIPGSSSCSGRAAWWQACSPTATSRRWSSRCAATIWRSSTRQAKAVAEVARDRPRRPRHLPVAARWTTPRSASRPTAKRRAWSA